MQHLPGMEFEVPTIHCGAGVVTKRVKIGRAHVWTPVTQ